MDSAYFSKSLFTALGFLLIVVVGLLDYVTGPHISFAIFYLLPISLVTWRVGRKMGIALAIAGAVLWLLADIMSGDTYPNVIIPYWNALVRLGFFLIVVFLLSALRTYNERLEATVGKRTAALKAEVVERTQAEELFGKAFHAAPGAMVLTRPSDGYIVDMNESALSLLGYIHEEVVGRTVDELGLVADPAESGRRRREVNENGRFRNIELGVRTKSGELRQVLVSADKVDSRDGQLVISVFIDITERKRAEEGLRASQERKDAILKSAVDGIITIDHQGKIVEFNPAAEKIFGYTREEVIKREMAELIIPPNLREQHRNGLKHYLATGEGPVLGKRIE